LTYEAEGPARVPLDANVYGMIATFQPFVTPMRAARRDALVGVANIAGYPGLPGAGAYCGSKAAAIAYLESLRVEMLCMGVAVVTVCPRFHRNADDRRQSTGCRS
jgi:NAD(P)-dependent dehydrogenase (short-subunit alcohol dehydrogenase family)